MLGVDSFCVLVGWCVGCLCDCCCCVGGCVLVCVVLGRWW